MPAERIHSQSSTYLKTTTADGKICKPSRKTFERQCKQLADEIHIIHTKLANNKAHLNELFAKLDKLRDERNAKFADKSSVEGTVKDMSVNINKLSERLAQLQSKLHYRDMKKLEDAIRTLQNHLDSRHFKHSEEKKIVAEIDKLNRSKKVVGEYLGTQKELKELRTSQHTKRVDRDKLIKDIVAIRKQEEDTRSNITTSKAQESQLRADMEDLVEHKKALKEEFTKHQQTYAEQKAAVKQAEMECRQKQQQQQLGRLSHSAATRCLSNSKQTDEDMPLTPEMVNCQKLIEFCERLTKQIDDVKATQRQKKKKISYTTDILAQFVSIDMCPPMTVAQACSCVPLLQQKLIELRQVYNMNTRLPMVEELLSQQADGDNVPIPTVKVEDTSTHVEPTTASDDQIPMTITAEEPHTEEMSEDELEIISEQPDDQSDKSSLTKQLSNTSEDDAIESILYKLELLDSLCNVDDSKSSDSSIA